MKSWLKIFLSLVVFHILGITGLIGINSIEKQYQQSVKSFFANRAEIVEPTSIFHKAIKIAQQTPTKQTVTVFLFESEEDDERSTKFPLNPSATLFRYQNLIGRFLPFIAANYLLFSYNCFCFSEKRYIAFRAILV